MVETAEQRMTLAEFLVWDDGTETRYELVGGQPRAMAPASGRHGAIQDNAAAVIRERLDRRRGRIVHQAGVLLNIQGDDRYYVPDLAVTCRAVSDTPYIDEPKFVVEVISPSTGRLDKDNKVPDYSTLPSVDEIWLIDSRKPLVHVYQRVNGQWIGYVPLRPGQSFQSHFLGGEVPVDDLYEGIDFTPPPANPEGG